MRLCPEAPRSGRNLEDRVRRAFVCSLPSLSNQMKQPTQRRLHLNLNLHGGSIPPISTKIDKIPRKWYFVYREESMEKSSDRKDPFCGVQFRPKSSYQKSDCINNSSEHKCARPSTLEAYLQNGHTSASIRCCTDEACKKRAADLALTINK